MRKIALPICCLWLILLAGCAMQPPPTMHSSSTRPLEQQLQAQGSQLDKLNDAMQQLSEAIAANRNELATLSSEIKQLQQTRSSAPQTPAVAAVQPQTSTYPASNQLPGQATPGKATATQLYLQGFSNYTSGNYQGAAQDFISFINNYPRNPYIANAYYWLGESYAAQEMVQEAISVFTTLVKEYPQANKAANGQLRLAQLYARSNQRLRAKTALLKLQQQYPKSSSAKKIPTELLESLSH